MYKVGDLVEITGIESYNHILKLGEVCKVMGKRFGEDVYSLSSTERTCYQNVHISEIKPYDNSHKYFFIEH